MADISFANLFCSLSRVPVSARVILREMKVVKQWCANAACLLPFSYLEPRIEFQTSAANTQHRLATNHSKTESGWLQEWLVD